MDRDEKLAPRNNNQILNNKVLSNAEGPPDKRMVTVHLIFYRKNVYLAIFFSIAILLSWHVELTVDLEICMFCLPPKYLLCVEACLMLQWTITCWALPCLSAHQSFIKLASFSLNLWVDVCYVYEAWAVMYNQ